MKNYFTFYRSYFEAIQGMEDIDRLQIYEAIMDYIFNGKRTNLKGMPLTVFILIKPTLEKSKILSENGKNGGAPKGNKNAKKQ